VEYQSVYDFWFKELSPKDWWKKSDELDATIRDRFFETHRAGVHGELFYWRSSAEGRLAEIILIDQFSRNMFRGKPESFAYDPIALVLAQEAVRVGADQEIEDGRSFMYMPYMHSESLVVHEEAVRLFSQPGMEGSLNFEMKHKVIIDQFGRYPHRNEILGRESTPAEIEFLKGPNSSF
jgi:uncharacterized protein (DUF924 family)